MKVEQYGRDGVEVSWKAPISLKPVVTGYTIYYQQIGGKRLRKAVPASRTTASITGLARGKTYCITVVSNSNTTISSTDPDPPAVNFTIGMLNWVVHTL